ncbi:MULTISPECIES: ATP-binding protein [Flavobacteriaceae]|uniref:Sensory/regulatory protein RpfC n=2 Tax=Flavobacteriaceae TaxID=49546 RepID=A0A4Y8ASC1_9FLAO|nr:MULTISPECIES: ATP-binding protein [Flavobacteriaceae]TEW73136.1 response regulator [Gramella jeungdoensis]GGK46737.1 hypothetical protein GCM10007963_13780 [Lutibacter litoralis]
MCIYKTAPNGRIINANSALVKLLGYNSKEELLAIDVKTQLYVDYKKRKDVIHHFSETEKIRHRLFKKDGSIIWVENYGEEIKNSDGELLYYEGIIRDVTEAKRANDILRVLLNISQNGYKQEDLKGYNRYIIGELGKLIDVSNSYIAYYNESRQTISIPFISGEEAEEEFPLAKSLTGYLIRNRKPLFLGPNQFKELEDAGEIELIGMASKVWLGVPLIIDGEVIGAIVVQSYDNENAYQQSDIDLLELVSSHISIAVQRKRKENEIFVSKQVLRKVLDNIPIRVFWKDKESRFLGCNKSFYEGISFKSDKEVIGKTDYDFNTKEVADKTRNDELEIINTGISKLKFIEKFIVNGEEVIFSSNKLPFIDQDNKIIGTIGTSADITKRLKSTEKLKIATEEAVSANLSKSIFLSNMSHEIRTPLNAILGYSQLLQDDDNLTKGQYENLKTINKSGEHLLSLINDVLDMSKIEAGRITLKEADFSLQALLKEVEGLFKFKAAQKSIELRTVTKGYIPEYIFSDESKIRQVIINLIGNAIKFTSKGFVQISIQNLKDNFINVIVKDSGIGILKEEQESVFKPFEQAKKGERVSGGTGLGLAISKKFSHLMEGDITIKSEYGKGSEFSFKFKYKECKQNQNKGEAEALKVVSLIPELKGLKLAIVDDRFENRDILYQKLNPLGFDIQQAENGLEAVELYKKWKPDIILLDVVMPVLNGIEATRQILQLKGNHNVKIFIVSASALESEQQEVMSMGATVFIKKPIKFVDLLAELVHKGDVKFVYEAQKKIEINNGNVSEIPKPIKDKFINAALEGDFLLLEELLIDLEKSTNKTFKPLDDCIREMEFEELINLLTS